MGRRAAPAKGRGMVRVLPGRQLSDAELLGRLLAGACAIDEVLLEALLAEGVPPATAVRRAVRGRLHIGVALLLGGAIALGGPGGAAAGGATTTPATAAALIAHKRGAAPELAPARAPELAPAGAPELAPAMLGELELVPGTALILPVLEVNAEGLAVPAQQTPGSYYVVQPGDTLSAIAQAAYGNAGLWWLIYDGNLTVIANANLIYPGQRLYLPPSGQIPPAGTPGGQTGQGQGQYTVRSGDTLSGIAQTAYGNGTLWWVIYDANRATIANPHWIYPGQVFTVPPYGTTTAGSAPGGSATPGTATPGSQTGRGPGLHTVSAGESLWSIAQLAYGNPARWVDIYNANAAIIGPNPSLIFAGTQLTIPA